MDAEDIKRIEAEIREGAAAELLRRSLWDAIWKQNLELEELLAREDRPGV